MLFAEHQGSQERTIPFVFDLPEPYGESNDCPSFALDGWLKFGIRLSFIGSTSGLADTFHQLETRVVIVSIADSHIQNHVRNFGSVHLFDVSGSQLNLFPPHESLKTVKRKVHLSNRDPDHGEMVQIQKQLRWDPRQTTFWLLCGKKNGVFSRAVLLDTLEELDFRLCELSEQRDIDNCRVVTLYKHTSEEDQLVRCSPPSMVLLFCMFLNPREHRVEYCGSIVADANTKLHSICFDDLYRLCDKLQDMECAFFIVDVENHAKQIRAFQKTAREVLCVRVAEI